MFKRFNNTVDVNAYSLSDMTNHQIFSVNSENPSSMERTIGDVE